MKLHTLLLLGFTAISFLRQSQGQALPLIWQFDKRDYQAQAQNWDITQAEDGTLFVANNGGMLEYDGSRWRLYTLPHGQVVRAVAWHEGKVYVGGYSEFGYFERDHRQKWRYVSLSNGLQSEQARTEEIWHILVRTSTGEVFFQSFSTIFRYDGKQVRQITPPCNLMFLEQLGRQVFFYGIGSGMYELLEDGGFRFIEGSELLASEIVTFILPGAHPGELLVGTRNAGLFVVGEGYTKPWNQPANTTLEELQPNKALKLADGGYAIGTIRQGIFLFDNQQRLTHHIHRGNGLQNNTVLALYEDVAGNLWVGLDQGIDVIQRSLPILRFRDLSGKLGTPYTAAIREGFWYIGTNQGVFIRHNNSLEGESHTLVAGTQGQVWALQSFGDALLCGHNEGTFQIDAVSARKISDVTGGWTFAQIPHHPDLLLQGTYTGLVVFSNKGSGSWRFERRIEGFSQPVRHLAMDDEGYWWAAHPTRGLWRLRLNADFSRVVEMRRYDVSDGLPTDFRLHLTHRADTLVVQAGHQLLRIAGGKLFPMRTLSDMQRWIPLAKDTVFTAYPDRIQYEDPGRSLSFPLSLVPNNETIIRLNDSLFFLCLEDGYAIWNDRLPWPSSPSNTPPRISAIEILGERAEWFFPFASDSTWQTPAKRNNLRIYATHPFLTRHHPLRWVVVGPTSRTQLTTTDFIELTGLPSGEYHLSVSVDPNGSSYHFHFEVLPPWWQSWWAIVLWVALAGALMLGMERFYRRRLERHRQHLLLEKEKALEAQRLEAERRSLQREVANRSRELSNATINLIRKNEALQSLLQQIPSLEMAPNQKQKLRRLIESHLSADDDWLLFEEAFNQVHDAFFKKLKNRYPHLTTGDLRLAAFLRLQLSSKEIASLLGISVRGVENKRYRLRKKLDLSEGEDLADFITRI